MKNMKVNGKDDIPYIMENKKCLKPPTRYKIREPNSCTCKYKIFENVNYLHCDMILMKPMVRTPSDPSASRSMNESVVADISCISL